MAHLEKKPASEILHKIKSIEKELMDLKLSILSKYSPTEKKIISLKGILKGVEITDKDIGDAKKSIYSHIEI
jgi:hypothetical protein